MVLIDSELLFSANRSPKGRLDVIPESEFSDIKTDFLPKETDVMPESEFGDNLQGLDRTLIVQDILPESAFDGH